MVNYGVGKAVAIIQVAVPDRVPMFGTMPRQFHIFFQNLREVCVKLSFSRVRTRKVIRHSDLHCQSGPENQTFMQHQTGNWEAVSYTHLRAHETDSYLVCR